MVRQYRKRPNDEEADEARGSKEAERSRSRSRSSSRERKRSYRGVPDQRHRSGHEHKPTVAANSIQRGKVTSVRDFGFFVRLDNERDRDGLVHISHAVSVRIEVEELRQLFPVGRRVWTKVLSTSPDGKISLSTKLVDQHTGVDLDPQNTGKATREVQQGTSKADRDVPSASEAGGRFVEPIGPVSHLHVRPSVSHSMA